MNTLKGLIATAALIISSITFSQNWHHVGTPGSIASASEIEFEIAENGDMYVFYVNYGSSNNGIKTWNGTSWVSVGSLNWLPSDANDLRLECLTDGTPAISYRYSSGGQDYIRVYLWTGSFWDQYGSSFFATDDFYPYDMNVSENDGVYLAYYKDLNGYPGVLNEINYCSLTSTNGTAMGNPLSEYTSNSISIATDGNETQWETHGEYDIGIYTPLNYFDLSNFTAPPGGGTMHSSGILASEAEIRYVDGSEKFVAIWKEDNNPTNPLYMRYYDIGADSYGPPLYISANVFNSDFAIASDGYAYTMDEHTGYGMTRVDLTDMSTITYANNFIPGTAAIDNPKVDTENDIIVVAWINQITNQIEVYEEDNPASISLSPNPTTCSGSYYSVVGPNFIINDNNYDHSYLSFNVISDNDAVINSNDVVIGGTYPNYTVQFPSAPLAADDQIELTIEVYEDGNYVTEDYLYINLKALPAISSNLPSPACDNDGFFNLMPHVTPSGGTFTGTGVNNNKFHPSVVGAGSYDVVYSVTGANGCVNKDTSTIMVNSSPVLAMSSTQATCGNLDGTATVDIDGGSAIGAYSIYWSNGESNVATIDDLAMGSYYVNVTNADGCTSVGSASVSSTAFTLSANLTQIDCHGDTDGAIDLTINGTTGPYTVVWSTGATIEDLSNLPSGAYDVTVTDNAGCQAVETYIISDPGEIFANVTITHANCGLGDGSLESNGSGGTGTLSYQWFEGDGTYIDNSALITSLEGGSYYVVITDANGCTKLENVTLNENGGPTITIDSVFNVTCSSQGAIFTTVNSAAAIQSLDWSNGATTPDITGLNAGYYSVVVEDVNSCIGTASVTVTNQGPDQQLLCMVTVDSATNTNRIVWEKPVSTDISHYNIYRESSVLGVYQFVDSVLYADESFFNDTIASPLVRSWRYKISAVDNCGVESDLSDVHKTIHLTINTGLSGLINLAWDEYEGFPYSTFDIWRYTTLTGWMLIQSLPSNSFSFSDVAPSASGLTYMIVITPPSMCTSVKATDYNSSRSNKSYSAAGFGPGVGLDELENGYSLYPNPTSERFTVYQTGQVQETIYSLRDAQGRIILTKTTADSIIDFDLIDFESGIYYLSFKTDDGLVTEKIVKQ